MTGIRIALLHYTAPPIVGGVENVIAQHTRLLVDAGYPVTLLTGRGGSDATLAGVNVVLIPELDSEYPENLEIARTLEGGSVPAEFHRLQARVEHWLAPIFAQADVVIVHNVFNFHFNLPLTAALHRLLDCGRVQRLAAWCHDVSRHVNPHSQRFPNGLKRGSRRPDTFSAGWPRLTGVVQGIVAIFAVHYGR